MIHCDDCKPRLQPVRQAGRPDHQRQRIGPSRDRQDQASLIQGQVPQREVQLLEEWVSTSRHLILKLFLPCGAGGLRWLAEGGRASYDRGYPVKWISPFG